MNSFKKNIFIAQSRGPATSNMGWACREKASKCRKIFALRVSLIVVGLIIGSWAVDSYAAAPASDAIKQEFEQKMGRNWYSASDKEQKIFLRSREIIKQRKSGKGNNQKKKYTQKSGGYEGASLAVRYNFEKQGKGSWENASKEEQGEFKKRYLKELEKQKKIEADLAKKKRGQEENRRKILLNEKKTKEKRRRSRIKKAQNKIKAVRKKRERFRKRMNAAKKRINILRKQANKKRR